MFDDDALALLQVRFAALLLEDCPVDTVLLRLRADPDLERFHEYLSRLNPRMIAAAAALAHRESPRRRRAA